MRKFFVSLTLLSLLVTTTGIGLGQTRPRRVGTSTSAPQTTTPSATTPSRPPVLGGVNNPGNRPQQTQDNQAPAGPEEVDAGDIVRVNTTLVTIPVSVMDRDGRYVPNLQKEEFRVW